jgi:hypothetical protein
MDSKKMLLEQIEKVKKAMEGFEAGSEEYDKLLKQYQSLLDSLAEMEKAEKEQSNEAKKFVIKCVEVGSAIALPLIGLAAITNAEKGLTFTGALKGYAQMFVPKNKLF